MELLQVDLMDEAQKKLYGFIRQIPVRTKKVSLREGAYTRLAADIPAPEDVPLFNRSTVDGYAVIAALADIRTRSSEVILFMTMTLLSSLGSLRFSLLYLWSKFYAKLRAGKPVHPYRPA